LSESVIGAFSSKTDVFSKKIFERRMRLRFFIRKV